jgi:hypothetical protein
MNAMKPYRVPTPLVAMAPKSVPLSFWQRIKPTVRFGAPVMLWFPGVVAYTFVTPGKFVSRTPLTLPNVGYALAVSLAWVLACLVVLAFWSEPYRTWRQRRVLAEAKKLSDMLK